MIHEFDTHRSICDSRDAVSNSWGNLTAYYLREWQRKYSLELPINARYLALGAGKGQSELSLAEKLDIDLRNVVLLDREFTPQTARYLQTNYPDATRISPPGIFTFLQNPPEDMRDFSVVSAFGLDYIIEEPEKFLTLIHLLPNALVDGAIVAVAPFFSMYCSEDQLASIENMWRNQGFTPIYNDVLSMYVYEPNNESTVQT